MADHNKGKQALESRSRNHRLSRLFRGRRLQPYLVRDNDGAYGPVFKRRVRAMGIRDRPISPRSPWQNPYAERLIGTLRRDCLLMPRPFHPKRDLAAQSAFKKKAFRAA